MPRIIIVCSGVSLIPMLLDMLLKYELLPPVVIEVTNEPPVPKSFYELQNLGTLDELQNLGFSDEPQYLSVSNTFVKKRDRYPSINNPNKHQINICRRRYIAFKRIRIP